MKENSASTDRVLSEEAEGTREPEHGNGEGYPRHRLQSRLSLAYFSA